MLSFIKDPDWLIFKEKLEKEILTKNRKLLQLDIYTKKGKREYERYRTYILALEGFVNLIEDSTSTSILSDQLTQDTTELMQNIGL